MEDVLAKDVEVKGSNLKDFITFTDTWIYIFIGSACYIYIPAWIADVYGKLVGKYTNTYHISIHDTWILWEYGVISWVVVVVVCLGDQHGEMHVPQEVYIYPTKSNFERGSSNKKYWKHIEIVLSMLSAALKSLLVFRTWITTVHEKLV